MDLQRLTQVLNTRKAEKLKSGKIATTPTRRINATGELGKNLINLLANQDKETKVVDSRAHSPLVHVSSLLNILDKNYCPLRHKFDYLHLKEGNQPLYHMYSRIDLTLNYIFAVGRTYEEITRDVLTHNAQPSTIFGKFQCNCGALNYSGENIPLSKQNKCSQCGTKQLKYLEYPLRVGALIGSPDMFIRLGQDMKYTILEHKSINKDGFDKLKVVSMKYRLQVMMYLGLLKYLKDTGHTHLNGVDIDEFDDTRATILYVAKKKGTTILDITKSFDIVWDEEYPKVREEVFSLIEMFKNLKDVTDYSLGGLGHILDPQNRIKGFDKSKAELCFNCPYSSNCENIKDKAYKEVEEGVL